MRKRLETTSNTRDTRRKVLIPIFLKLFIVMEMVEPI